MISERTFASSFDSFWRELLPLLTPRFVQIFNEAYELPLEDVDGSDLGTLPISSKMKHPDIVAEFAFRLARLAEEHGVDLATPRATRTKRVQQIIEEAEEKAFALIHHYKGKPLDTETFLSKAEKDEGINLAQRYRLIGQEFTAGSKLVYCPQFPGSGFIDSCEGDIEIGPCLLEVKTTTRKPSSRDIRQMIVYLALSSNSGNHRHKWTEVGVFNPRRGTLHRIDIESLILRISGGRSPSDVFADLISFTESNPLVLDKKF